MKPELVYNARQVMGGAMLLARLEDASVGAAFFDPQHRGVLDRQDYGNEGARQQGRVRLQQMDAPTIRWFCEEIERVVKPGRYVFLWVDKFSVLEGIYNDWLSTAPALKKVGKIVWDKMRIGMGRRERYRHEEIIVLQKQPAKGAGWSDHGIDDVWPEQVDRARHTHAKPMQLTCRLIKATTKRGDLVLDPAAGGYVVLDAAVYTGRRFIGCDIREE